MEDRQAPEGYIIVRITKPVASTYVNRQWDGDSIGHAAPGTLCRLYDGVMNESLVIRYGRSQRDGQLLEGQYKGCWVCLLVNLGDYKEISALEQLALGAE